MNGDLNKQRLEACGIRPTRQRVALAGILFAQEQHLSAERLLRLAREQGVPVSKATVYNTLNLFARQGLVREVLVDPARVFYDSNVSQHHHFYNVDTGELTDVPADSVSFERLPGLPDGTQPDGVDVIIRVRGHSYA